MNEFQNVFDQLKPLLQAYEESLVVNRDTLDTYDVNTKKHPLKPSEEGFFGSVQIKKNYVSFHLFPIYVFPALLDGISAQLKQRMQGKSCFNFKKSDAVLFKELQALVQRAFEKFRAEGLIE